MDIQNFQDILLERARAEGFTESEVSVTKSDNFTVKAFAAEVDSISSSKSAAAAFRGLFNGKMGYAYSEKISEEIVGYLIKEAKENAEIIESDDLEEIYAGDDEYPDFVKRNAKLAMWTENEKIADCLKMEAAAKLFDERIEAVETSLLSTGDVSISLKNSKGLDLFQEQNHMIAYVSVLAKEENDLKSGLDFYLGVDADGFVPETVGELAAKKACLMLGAEPVQSGLYDIVLENSVAGDFFAAFVNLFYADRAQKGLSLLKDKEGEKIANAIVSISDDSLFKGQIGSSNFDSEGVAGQNTTIVKDGVFESFLHSLKTAKKAGKKSTSNGYRPSYKAPVDTMHTNFYIHNGAMSFDDLLQVAGSGLLIRELDGLHTINAVSGEFSLSASGFLIEAGLMAAPVEQITISGNFLELMQNIDAIADDLKFSPFGGVGSPSLFIKGINVSGK